VILYREDECAHHSADQGREVEHRDHQATYFMILNTSIIIIKWYSLSQSFSFHSPYPKVLVPTLSMRQYPEWDTPNGTHFVHCLITHFQPLRSHQPHQFTISICRLRPPRILDPRPNFHLITSSTLIKSASLGTNSNFIPQLW